MENKYDNGQTIEKIEKDILEIINKRVVLVEKCKEAEKKATASGLLLVLSYIILIGILIPWFRRNAARKSLDYETVKKELKLCTFEINFNLSPEIEDRYERLKAAFKRLGKTKPIWDITKYDSSSHQDDKRTFLDQDIDFKESDVDFIISNYKALEFNGSTQYTFYLYPEFLLIYKNDSTKMIFIKIQSINYSATDKVFKESTFYEGSEVLGQSQKCTEERNPNTNEMETHCYTLYELYFHVCGFFSKEGIKKVYAFNYRKVARSFSEELEKYVNAWKDLCLVTEEQAVK